MKKKLKKLFNIKKSSHAIAFSFAIGTFISILPTPGLNILGVLLMIFLFPKLSKLASLIGLFIWRPIYIPILAFSYAIGYFFPFNIAFQFIAGNFVLAGITSIVSYYLVYGIVSSKRDLKKQN